MFRGGVAATPKSQYVHTKPQRACPQASHRVAPAGAAPRLHPITKCGLTCIKPRSAAQHSAAHHNAAQHACASRLAGPCAPPVE